MGKDIKEKFGSKFNAKFPASDPYVVKTGSLLIDGTNGNLKTVIGTDTFETPVTKPNYKFGDEFEFNEAPSKKDIFTEYIDFKMSDFDATLSGTGFLKLAGGFRIMPNF